ncbi:MAG: TIM-barrel domain-containing protein [Christensenellales bacterium]
MLFEKDGALCFRYEHEVLQIEPWGKNALRVRATMQRDFSCEDFALLPQEARPCQITVDGDRGSITNGKITAVVDKGTIAFADADGNELLSEQWQGASMPLPKFVSLKYPAREYIPLKGGAHRLEYRLNAYRGEKLYGMGQYQDGTLNKKGATFELAQRNSQASVPFVLSDRGYGFLWNNPAVGKATFAENKTEWVANVTDGLDYWITADDTPALILQNYLHATGLPPMMPEYAMGFWQCKLRYRTQEQVLSVAREYKARGIPLDVIVIDYFHWTLQGEWKFDPHNFPDPDAMVKELKDMGVETMVSVWPTVDSRCENYAEMLEKGYLVHCNRGVPISMTFFGDELFFDATNPESRAFVWQKVCENYFQKGIRLFWLDVAEPEYTNYDFDAYTYQMGPVEKVGNIYPALYAKLFYDGLKENGVESPISLIRCAWAGSQRYGALVWSGDIATNFETLRNQIAAGLSMAVAGIPWWTTDIGGFHGGDQNDPEYRELLIRWFQWAVFCPVMRLHGDRLNGEKDIGDSERGSGGPNEVWSYGEEAYEILKKHIALRYEMRPYIEKTMRLAHEKGETIMAPLFMGFPKDKKAWEIEDEFLFGSDYLVAPITALGARERSVYFPESRTWTDIHTGATYRGGETAVVPAPLEYIPVFKGE